MSENVRKRTLFLGTTTNKVDAKGRVSLPSDFRALLKDQNTVIVAYRSFITNCIEGCTAERMETIFAEIEKSHDPFSEEQDELTNLIFADAQEFNFDSTGRILLTEKLLKHAGINDKAVFVGKGSTFQIWTPEKWEKEEALMREKALIKRPHIKRNLGE